MRVSPILFSSKATRSALTSKRGNKDYYKGTGGGRAGTFTKKGQYVLNPEKIREWIIPDMGGCELRPYVSQKTRPIPYVPLTPQCFLNPTSKTKDSSEPLAPPPAYRHFTTDYKSPAHKRLLGIIFDQVRKRIGLSNIRLDPPTS